MINYNLYELTISHTSAVILHFISKSECERAVLFTALGQVILHENQNQDKKFSIAVRSVYFSTFQFLVFLFIQRGQFRLNWQCFT